MSLFETLSKVEDQSVQLERARAVLSEVMHYFERNVMPGSMEAYCLTMKTGHISLLLDVVDSMMYAVLPELDRVAEELIVTVREGD